jgi:glucosyl-3-phosphoglycerate synthase
MVFRQDRFTTDFGRVSNAAIEESFEHMKTHPLFLFLPATYADAQNSEVMDHILAVVNDIQANDASIDNIVLGLDAAKEKKQFEEVKEKLRHIPNAKIIWNNAPEIQELYQEFEEQGLPTHPGKGRNMWTGLGYRYMTDRDSSFVIHDCDIKPDYYSRDFVMSLITPILHPKFGEQHFTKAYYTRITPAGDTFKLGGRATRLLVFPFLEAVRENYGKISKKILDYVDHLASFNYPLAGEFAMRSNLANSLQIQPDWGLEIGSLSSLFQTEHLAQVDLGLYDHKHSEISEENPEKGLNKMAEDIVKTVFRKLYSLAEEEALDNTAFAGLMYDYKKYTDKYIAKYMNLSESKGWHYDEVAEVSAKHTFREAIQRAYDRFTADPEEVQSLPTWGTINHEKRKRLVEIVDHYNE